jgi:hypothetical protein
MLLERWGASLRFLDAAIPTSLSSGLEKTSAGRRFWQAVWAIGKSPEGKDCAMWIDLGRSRTTEGGPRGMLTVDALLFITGTIRNAKTWQSGESQWDATHYPTFPLRPCTNMARHPGASYSLSLAISNSTWLGFCRWAVARVTREVLMHAKIEPRPTARPASAHPALSIRPPSSARSHKPAPNGVRFRHSSIRFIFIWSTGVSSG